MSKNIRIMNIQGINYWFCEYEFDSRAVADGVALVLERDGWDSSSFYHETPDMWLVTALKEISCWYCDDNADYITEYEAYLCEDHARIAVCRVDLIEKDKSDLENILDMFDYSSDLHDRTLSILEHIIRDYDMLRKTLKTYLMFPNEYNRKSLIMFLGD